MLNENANRLLLFAWGHLEELICAIFYKLVERLKVYNLRLNKNNYELKQVEPWIRHVLHYVLYANKIIQPYHV